MTTETVNNTYENGKRISTQQVTYDKSDDLFTLANLQKQYESVCKHLELATSDSDSAHLTTEKARLESEIAAQEATINGYEQEG